MLKNKIVNKYQMFSLIHCTITQEQKVSKLGKWLTLEYSTEKNKGKTEMERGPKKRLSGNNVSYMSGNLNTLEVERRGKIFV